MDKQKSRISIQLTEIAYENLLGHLRRYGLPNDRQTREQVIIEFILRGIEAAYIPPPPKPKPGKITGSLKPDRSPQETERLRRQWHAHVLKVDSALPPRARPIHKAAEDISDKQRLAQLKRENKLARLRASYRAKPRPTLED